RERPRRTLEVCRDGTIVMPGRERDRRAHFESRFGVSVSGDRVVFSDGDDHRVASLLLPWIAPEDRQELARRFAELVDPAPPEPSGDSRTMPSVPGPPASAAPPRLRRCCPVPCRCQR